MFVFIWILSILCSIFVLSSTKENNFSGLGVPKCSQHFSGQLSGKSRQGRPGNNSACPVCLAYSCLKAGLQNADSIRKYTKKTQAILREINELLRSMKQFFLDSHVHFSLLNYIQNFSMSRMWKNVMEIWKVFRSLYN